MFDPYPGGPEYAHQQRLGMPRWNVDDQIPDPTFRDSLQMGADGANVNALDKRRTRFQYKPRLEHEFLQATARLLRLHPFQLEP